MTAIEGSKRNNLPDASRGLMDAVRQGELDMQIEDVAEQGRAGPRLKFTL
jgi:hypothetical protein